MRGSGGKRKKMSDNPKELATIIAAFLNKHGGNRKKLPISGYDFEVKGIYNIDISVKSISILPNESVQFYGSASVNQYDAASKVTTDVKVNFNGVAFFVTDVQGDESLYHVSIDQMKQSTL